MSDWVKNDFALRYFSLQPNYKQVSLSPLKLRCKCPVCGDSAKDSSAARFWYFDYKNEKFVHCYNCDHSSTFSRFLEEYDPELYKEFNFEMFKDSKPSTKAITSDKIKINPIKKAETISKLSFCQCLSDLTVDHPIIKYVKNRKIPESQYYRLFFTDQWQKLVNSIKPDTYPKPVQEYRLVIPIFNKNKKIESFQGRALKEAKNKYITIKVSEDSSKVYGQDEVSTGPVFVMEGPIDSLFIPNSIAITGGSINLESVPFKDRRIWVLDNEPRHPDTMARLEKLIDCNEIVCFWDQAPWNSKDINDMVKNESADPKEIKQYILENCCNGLEAKLRFSRYCKV